MKRSDLSPIDIDEIYVNNTFAKQCRISTAETLLKRMSFKIPLDDLYEVKRTCNSNEQNSYCPVLLAIRDS